MKSANTIFAGLTALSFFLIGAANALGQTSDEISFDGLERVDSSRVHIAYINPDADFSVFKRVAILEP
jgi:hypothetical protein